MAYLFDGTEIDPDAQYEFSITDDEMILQRSTGKKYHNMDLDVIEDRLWNGYYCTPKQFLKDISFILEDANMSGDREKILKVCADIINSFIGSDVLTYLNPQASEMHANVLVSLDEIGDAQFLLDCERVLERETQRAEIYKEKVQRRQEKMQEIQRQHRIAMEEREKAEEAAAAATASTRAISNPRTIENMFSDDDVEAGGDEVTEKENEPEAAGGNNEVDAVDEVEAVHPTDISMSDADITGAEQSEAAAVGVATTVEPAVSPGKTSSYEVNGTLTIMRNSAETASEAPLVTINQQDSSPEPEIPHPPYRLDTQSLEDFHTKLASDTENFTIEQLEQLNSAVMDIAYRGRLSWDRNAVLKEAAKVADTVARDISTAVNRD